MLELGLLHQASSRCSLGSLGLLLLLPEILSEESLKTLIGDLLVTLELRQIQLSSSSDDGGTTWLDNYSCLELSYKLSLLLGQNWVWHQHVVVKAFSYSNLSCGLIGHCSNGEWQSWETLVNLNEESTSTLHLQVINLIQFSLINGASLLALFWLSLSRRDVDIESNDVTWGELELLNVAAWSGSVNNCVISINQMLLNLVRQDTLNCIAAVLLGNLLDHLSHVTVG